jgi:transposase
MMTSVVHRGCAYLHDAPKGHTIWLFADSVAGAKASANLYSLAETAKANALEPYLYLRHVFTELPKAQTLDDIEALLPYNCDPKKLFDTITPP